MPRVVDEQEGLGAGSGKQNPPISRKTRCIPYVIGERREIKRQTMVRSYKDRHCQQSSSEDVEMILDGSRGLPRPGGNGPFSPSGR